MKTLRLFLEDFKEDEEELQSNKPISNIDLAHSLALTTCSFEFECYVDVYKTYSQLYQEELEDDYEEDYYEDESQDATREDVYDELHNLIKHYFKTNKVKVSTNYHGIPTAFKIANPDYWFIEYDGSLDSEYNGYEPVEIISPWVPAKDAEAFLRKFKKDIFDRVHGMTDDTTGMHVNLRTKGIAINPLKLLFLFDEVDELKKFKREESEYSEPHGFNQNLADKLEIVSKHYNLKNPNILKTLTKRLKDVLDRSKKKSVNFKDYNFGDGSGRIEFRIIGNGYFNSLFKTTLESVNKFIMLMSSASDDKTHITDLHTNFNKILKGSVGGKAVTKSISTKIKKRFDILEKKDDFDIFLNGKKYIEQFIEDFKLIRLNEELELYEPFNNFFNKANKYFDVKTFIENREYKQRYLEQTLPSRSFYIYYAYMKLLSIFENDNYNEDTIRDLTRSIFKAQLHGIELRNEIMEFIETHKDKFKKFRTFSRDELNYDHLTQTETRIQDIITGQVNDN